MFKDEADFKKVVGRLKIDTEPNPEHRENLRRQMLDVFNQAEQKPSTRIIAFRTLGRIIMKSPVTKIAAIIVVITGILLGLYFTGGPFSATVTFADVIRPILNARTASLDILVGSQENQSVIHDDVMGSIIRRTVSNIQGPDIIIDLEQQKVLTIDHTKKTATYIGLSGLPDVQNYVELLGTTIIRLQNMPDFQVEDRGIEEFDGTDYLVFVASGDNDTVTVWADQETALPVRIEHKTPNMQIVCENLQFDVAFDESLFSMEAPDGYEVHDAGALDFSDSSESAFIETLRIWAQIIEDGQFPDSINLKDAIKLGPKFDQGMKRAGLTEDEQAEVAMRWGQGLVFIRFFKGQGQWYYAGQGVELGDSDKPIFWYQPQESQTWRVIYGDLHVEDVAEQDLPNPALSDRQIKIIRSSEQWEKQEFTGTEKDLWHITGSGDIVVNASLTLAKMPEDTNVIYMKLPYKDGVLASASIDKTEIAFSRIMKGRYELELPAYNILDDTVMIECIWTMPLETLEKGNYGYRIRLQSLIPVEGFELTAVLDPDCGFEYTKDPSKKRMLLFSTSKLLAIKGNASCGLPISRIK